jgi:hypothetical protein
VTTDLRHGCYERVPNPNTYTFKQPIYSTAHDHTFTPRSFTAENIQPIVDALFLATKVAIVRTFDVLGNRIFGTYLLYIVSGLQNSLLQPPYRFFHVGLVQQTK